MTTVGPRPVLGRSAAARWAGAALALAGELAPSRPAAAAVQLANRLEAFARYRLWAATSFAGEGADSLVARARRAASLPPWSRMWALEGVGTAWATRASRDAGRGLLAGLGGPRPPARARLPLHTGLGMELARRRLGELPPSASAREARRWLARSRAEAERHAAPGWVPAVFEPAGFVVRTLRPGALGGCATALAGAGEWAGWFWHGVGRGAWFTPGDPSPAPAAPLAAAWREAPRGHRADALSGAAWALTLVNLRQPGLVRRTLRAALRDAADGPAAALADGVAAASWAWAGMAGADAGEPPGATFARLWPGEPAAAGRRRAGGAPEPAELFRAVCDGTG